MAIRGRQREKKGDCLTSIALSHAPKKGGPGEGGDEADFHRKSIRGPLKRTESPVTHGASEAISIRRSILFILFSLPLAFWRQIREKDLRENQFPFEAGTKEKEKGHVTEKRTKVLLYAFQFFVTKWGDASNLLFCTNFPLTSSIFVAAFSISYLIFRMYEAERSRGRIGKGRVKQCNEL